MEFMGQFSQEALRLTEPAADASILDVACGPGTLTLQAAPLVERVTAIDFAPEMVAQLRGELDRQAIENVDLSIGDGQDLTFADESFDAAYSMFGLMFFPDRAKGFGELYRTLRPGGPAVVSSWAPMADSPLMVLLFGAVRQMNPDMPNPERAAETLENPEVFAREMEAAGFREVTVAPVTRSVQAESVEDFWASMVRGSIPITILKRKLGARWAEKEALAVAYLRRELAGRPIDLASTAWFGCGLK
jgi:ubiquinone/menaquinone biosynthesis C-methylase UbiE